jgi:hypothetical protein
MTIGQLVECIIGKASAAYGGFADCTAFNNKGSKVNYFGEVLTKVGFHSSGNELLYNGMTGEQIESEIFIGPTYYMRLKHMVKDKINYRALGPRTALTRQPVSGRANDGGLRIGEMERDSVISHGASDFLRESMMERGDKYYAAICNTTGLLAIYNPSKNIFISPMADGPVKFVGSLDGQSMNIENVSKYGRDFSVICIPYSLKLLIQELQTVNIQMRLITEDNIEQLENMTYSKNIYKLNFVSETEKNKIPLKEMINKTIRETKANLSGKPINETPVSVSEETPKSIFDTISEAFIGGPSTPEEMTPEYLNVSPAYEPSESEKAEIRIRQENQESPLYNPLGSPESPLYAQQNQGESLPPQQVTDYNIGEQVYYRGDPSRVWNVKSIADNFITIETKQIEGLELGENIKVVELNEIYRATGGYQDLQYSNTAFPNNMYQMNNLNGYQPYGQYGGGGELYNQMMSFGGGGQGQAPFQINISPKIVGGNDFSSEKTEPNPYNYSIENDNKIENEIRSNNSMNEGGGTKLKKIDDEKKSNESSSSGFDTPFGKIDFSNFLIKKTG